MKKFIISFDYKGFMFRAKVFVKRDQKRMLISAAIINKEIEFLLEDGMLMFIQKGSGFELLLFKKDRSCEILNWNIQLEYLDRIEMVDVKAFGLS